MIDTITAAMAAYEIAVGPTPEYQTAWRSWAVGVYEFVAGGDTACDLLKGTLFGEPYPSPAAIGSASWCESPRLPWSVVTTYDWCTTTGTLRAGGSSSCEDACSICGGPNTAAFDGDGWCDGCDQDARLDGDGDGDGGGQPICPACGRPFTRATRLLVDHLPSTKTTDRATVYHAPSEPISCETSWAETHAQFSRVAREGRSRRR